MQVMPLLDSIQGQADQASGAAQRARQGQFFGDLLNWAGQSTTASSSSTGQQASQGVDALAELAAVAERLAAETATGASSTDPAGEPVMAAPSAHGAASSADHSGRNLRMSREDLENVRESLKKHGLTDEEMDRIERQIISPVGLTWGQFVSFLRQRDAKAEGVELTPSQKQNIQSFFQKLGMAPQQAESLLEGLRKGKAQPVMQAVQHALKNLPADSTVSFDKDEIVSLGAALRLSDKTLGRLNELVTGLAGGQILPKDLSSVVSMVQQDLLTSKKSTLTASKDLKDAVETALASARERAKRDRQADRHQDTTAKDLLLTAEDKRANKSEENGNAAAILSNRGNRGSRGSLDKAGEATDRASLRKDIRAEGDNHPGRQAEAAAPEAGRREEAGSRRGDLVRDAHDRAVAARSEALRNPAGSTGKDAGDKGGFSSSQRDEQAAWSEFFGKVRTSAREAQPLSTPAWGGAFAATTPAQQAELAARQSLEKVSHGEVLRQVQNGLMSSMSRGGKQLTLELTPDNLGKVNLVLQVQGGELKALIRTESEEVTKVVSEQLAQLKQNLEEQGVKVANIEVQTGLAGNDPRQYADLWQGAERERRANEEEALARMMARQRGGRNEAADVAQVMQNDQHRAIIARDGVDIFA